jgi:hypothetical protein
MSQGSPDLPAPPAGASRLWGVRIAALLGPIVFWAAVARVTIVANGYFAPPGCLAYSPPDQWPIFGIILTFVAAGLPYAHVLWRLGGAKYKKGLALAVMTGVGGFLILPAALFFAGPDMTDWGRPVGCALLLLSQGLLVVLALRAYHRTPRVAGDGLTFTLSIIPPLIYFVLFVPLFFVANFDLFPRRHPASSDVSPLVDLMAINMAEGGYAAQHAGSYSPTLEALKPLGQPSTKAYTFTYTAGPQGADGKIKTYTLTARPTAPCPGPCSCSFLMDETGIVRKTEKNRPATVHDPPLTRDEKNGLGVSPAM